MPADDVTVNGLTVDGLRGLGGLLEGRTAS